MNLPTARPQDSGDQSTWGSIDFWEPGKGVLGSSLCQPCPQLWQKTSSGRGGSGAALGPPLVISITHKESKAPADLETLRCLEAPGAERQAAGACTPEQRGSGEPARHSGLAQSSAIPANLTPGSRASSTSAPPSAEGTRALELGTPASSPARRGAPAAFCGRCASAPQAPSEHSHELLLCVQTAAPTCHPASTARQGGAQTHCLVAFLYPVPLRAPVPPALTRDPSPSSRCGAGALLCQPAWKFKRGPRDSESLPAVSKLTTEERTE